MRECCVYLADKNQWPDISRSRFFNITKIELGVTQAREWTTKQQKSTYHKHDMTKLGLCLRFAIRTQHLCLDPRVKHVLFFSFWSSNNCQNKAYNERFTSEIKRATKLPGGLNTQSSGRFLRDANAATWWAALFFALGVQEKVLC